tara:strand:+ start:242 stop:925 length:684 start_codon:yes stop_codon:yes gene_type:complete
MKNALILSLILLCSTSLFAQRKSKFKASANSKAAQNIEWNGSLSYGNTVFLGDLRHNSSERNLPNVALSMRFNKEKGSKKGYQLALTAGKNSGESEFDVDSFDRYFRSQYLQGHIAYRRAISKNESINSGKAIPQMHLLFGAGYYIADVKLFDLNLDNATPEKQQTVSSLYIPLGIEASYYLEQGFGFMASITNNLYLNDKIDLYEVKSNGVDNQLMFNIGMCYKIK